MKLTILHILFLSSLFHSFAQNKTYEITMKNRTFVPEKNISFFFIKNKSSLNSCLFQGKYCVLLQFYHLPGKKNQSKLSEKGIHIHNYLPHNTYVCTIEKKAMRSCLLSRNDVRAVVCPEPEDKIHNRIDTLVKSSEQFTFYLYYFNNVNPDDILTSIKQKDGKILKHDKQKAVLLVQSKKQIVSWLKFQPWLLWIEAYKKDKIFNF